MQRQVALLVRGLVLVFLLLAAGAAQAAGPDAIVGTWSAPSLSQRAVPIFVTLETDGTAREKIGDYQGSGTWKREGDGARILWGSEWVGLLRPTTGGEYELLTWKKGSPTDGKPDDAQVAKRVFQTEK